VRVLTFLALGVALALVAGACGGAGADDRAEIRFLVFGEPEELKAFREVTRAFREREDGRVQLITASDRGDLLARLSTSFAAGTPPDVFLLNYRFYGQFAARDALEPLEDRVQRSEAFSERDFYPQAIDAFRFGGTLQCLPQNISSLVVYYNRDLFRTRGVREPRRGWTWTEFILAAGQLTVDKDRDGRPEQYGLGVEPTLIRLAPFVWSNGGEVVDDERNPTRLALDSPAALEAMTQFLSLRKSYRVVPTDQEVEAEDDEARFMNGRLGMILSSRRSTPAFRTITAFDWDIAPLPRFRKAAGILHSDAYCMARVSKHKDEAWRFIEFALGPTGQRIVARTGRTVPSLISVSRSKAFLDPEQKPRNSKVFLDTIPTIRRVPSISTWPEIEDATDGILENGMYMPIAPEHIARQAIRATTPIFARAER
jgi:multiple sugar transport system substrate-binding protein